MYMAAGPFARQTKRKLRWPSYLYACKHLFNVDAAVAHDNPALHHVQDYPLHRGVLYKHIAQVAIHVKKASTISNDQQICK